MITDFSDKLSEYLADLELERFFAAHLALLRKKYDLKFVSDFIEIIQMYFLF